MTRPSTVFSWGTGTGADLTPPPPSLISGGYIGGPGGTKPAASDINWAFNQIGQWIAYFDSLLPVVTYGGDGSDGEFHPLTDTSITGVELARYSSIYIPTGVTVTLYGPNAGQDILNLLVAGDIDIHGTLTSTGGGLAGGSGGAGAASNGVPGGNGTAGTSLANPPWPGMRTGGAGALGAAGSTQAASGLTGGAGAGVTDGADGPADTGPYNPRAAASGGEAGPDLTRLPFPFLFPGSGGGGGSGGSNWAGVHGNDGGAGGKGAAAVFCEAAGNVTIHPGGVLSVAGEPGHAPSTTYPMGISGGYGGPGGGGTMLLRCRSFTNNGTLTEGTGKVLVQLI
jgi:hypothetical protein